MDSTVAEKGRGRDEQILSAKKKLKNYRAKQAKIARSQSSVHLSQEVKNPPAAAASPIVAELTIQAEENQRRHSHGASRSGHGRGHSRAGSISISAMSLGSPAGIPTSSSAKRLSAAQARPTSAVFPASSSSSSHLRTHSRSGSRTILNRSRPSSMLLGAGKDAPQVLAVEHPAGVNPLGDWKDVQDSPARPMQFEDASTLFASPASKRKSHHDISGPANSSVRLSQATEPASAPATATGSTLPSSSSSSSMHARRQSRHARRTSVSTKRESMEIMGGVGMGIAPSFSTDSIATSRRRSSRMSGLPSASVLFGTGANGSDVQSWNWKAAFAKDNDEDDEQGRLTALEKLEGRCQQPESTQGNAVPQEKSSGRPLSVSSRRMSGHQRQSSVQLPSFDDVHGADGMDRRASLRLLEANERNTASSPSTPSHSELPPSGSRESLRGLAPPAASSSLLNSPSSPSLTAGFVSSPKRPESILVHTEQPQPEGLGTLMEEEEEEESMSPVRERLSLDAALAERSAEEEEKRKQRRREEEEIVRRNRRASLTPRPLKLKSRPPSLYLHPATRGVGSSPSLPTLSDSTPSSPVAASASSVQGDATPRVSAKLQLAPEPEEPSEPVSCSSDSVSYDSYDSSSAPSRNEIIRAYRTSMSAAPESMTPASAPLVGARPQRQGMRTLRLGSQTSLASLASLAESSSSSSASANVSSANSSANTSHRRLSLIGSGAGSISLSREELGQGTPSSASVRNMRRSSIHYKPSTSTHPIAEDSISGHSSNSSIASIAGVPVAVHDELKAKASRDAALLESTKEQVDRLQRELSVESERNAREYAELERWSAEEKRQLSERIDELEKSSNRNAEELAALQGQLAENKERMEDVEAERDMLSDDVEGWRSRCQDLEKSLRSERSKLEEQRKVRSAAKAWIQKLTQALESNGVPVPSDDLNICQLLDEPHLDLAAVLRSPALGSPSPVLPSSGYFSPHLAQDPPPQAIKLLADMRQQIFNLAGSLEHERTAHLKAKDELSRLQEERDQALANQHLPSANTSYTTSVDAADDSRDSSNSSMSKRMSGNNGVVGKNKRHVFAYDSSMGSFGQSHSSASLGSASLSMTTDDMMGEPADEDAELSSPSKLPAASAESEMIGMGISLTGGLQTLDEIEEVSESGEGSSAVATSDCDTAGEAERRWTADIEAGGPEGIRPSLDVSESSFGCGGPRFEDANELTPSALEAQINDEDADTFVSPLPSPLPKSSKMEAIKSMSEHSTRSSGSSIESHDGPATPPLDAHQQSRYLHDDMSADISRAPSPRPEFIPNWNFDMAIRRGRLSSRHSHGKQDSIEDFFGIMQDRVLPPLSTSEEAMDMPPISMSAMSGVVQSAPGTWPAVVSTRVASVGGGRRPPVARSAYIRESFSESQPAPATHQIANSFSATSSAAALGSRALSRMSLQGLTSAFSGLSGYLTNQSGAAVHAAASATRMCAPGEEAESTHASMSWSVQKRAVDEDEEGWATRPVRSSMMPSGPGSWSSGGSTQSQSQSKKAVAASRNFVDKASIPPPMATPIWQLDFTNSTAGGSLITL